MKRILCVVFSCLLVITAASGAWASTADRWPTIYDKFPDGKVGVEYISDHDAWVPSKATWSVESGTLPPGLSFAEGARTGARLTGTPTEAGIFYFGVRATYADGSSITRDDFFIKIEANDPVINGTFAGGQVKTAYLSSVSASNCTAPYKWECTGNLPDGLTLSGTTTDTVTLSGIPSSGGTYEFTLTFTDGKNTKAEKTFSVVIMGEPEPDPLELTTSFKTSGKVKASYTGTASITGGSEPYEWVFEGSLPPGLKLKIAGTTATMTGKPTTAGTYTFTLTATDKNGESASKTVKLKITEPTITGTLTDGAIKAPYTATLKASGGTSSYTWTKSSGTLPTGLSLGKTTGTLSGTPTKAGEFTFTVKVTDKNGATATKTFTITITKPEISGTLKAGTVKKSYSATLKATGGTAPYIWTKSSGTLPAGLKLTKSTGKISGKPTKAGEFTFKVKVTDANGATATKSYTVTINASSSSSVTSDNGYIDGHDAQADPETEEVKPVTDDESFTLNSDSPEVDSGAGMSSFAGIEIHAVSEDILTQETGRDDDIVEVRAGTPVRFVITGYSDVQAMGVYVDDELQASIAVSESGEFTVPADMTREDFKVQAKTDDAETRELFVVVTEQTLQPAF